MKLTRFKTALTDYFNHNLKTVWGRRQIVDAINEFYIKYLEATLMEVERQNEQS